jgi:hypothetical protein
VVSGRLPEDEVPAARAVEAWVLKVLAAVAFRLPVAVN